MTKKDTSEKLAAKTAEWLENTHNKKLDRQLLEQSCSLAEKLAGSHKPAIAEALLEKGLSMATQLEKLQCDSETLAAAILYPSFQKSTDTKELITKAVGKNIFKLLIGTDRMEVIDTLQSRAAEFGQQQNQTDNIRKMLLAMVDDIRVALIKLAERLVTLIYLNNYPKETQQHIAQQTMDLYAPLSNRLGIGQFKWQMEDLAFRHLDPDSYEKISKALNMHRKDRDDYIHKMIGTLEKLLKKAHIEKADISGRAKHIYSIYRKTQRKSVGFEEVYDTSAFRILVPDIQTCYSVLGIVHTEWEHIPQEFDDYIAKPKPNGYRSIHTAVIGPGKKNIEIQIRTDEMHEEAELGVAAHWKYKEDKKKSSPYEEKINWLREVMDWQKEVSQEELLESQPYKKIFEDRVYVFTPDGDVLDMAAGATPLDFAYHIHTEVGNRCHGAKINGSIAPLTTALKNGDRVEILTSKQGHPSHDWLNPSSGYLKTSHALTKARSWFKKQDYEQNLETGEAAWEKAHRRAGVSKTALEDVYQLFNFKSINDLLAGLGAGDINVTTILNRIRGLNAPSKKLEAKLPLKKPSQVSQKQSGIHISIEGVGNLLTQLARCCQPIPGDPITGYITKGRGITIHKTSCANIKKAMQYRSERVLEVDWGTDMPQKYPVDLWIEATERAGLMHDISKVIANEHITILGSNSRVNKLKNLSYMQLTLEIEQLEVLEKIIREIQQIPDVLNVQRKK